MFCNDCDTHGFLDFDNKTFYCSSCTGYHQALNYVKSLILLMYMKGPLYDKHIMEIIITY